MPLTVLRLGLCGYERLHGALLWHGRAALFETSAGLIFQTCPAFMGKLLGSFVTVVK